MSEIAIITAELDELVNAVPVGSLWRHRSGGTYEVVGHCILEANVAAAVLYVPFGKKVLVWARDGSEFRDGRFTRLDCDDFKEQKS